MKPQQNKGAQVPQKKREKKIKWKPQTITVFGVTYIKENDVLNFLKQCGTEIYRSLPTATKPLKKKGI